MTNVVNLWVVRRAREIERDGKRLLWVCKCGCCEFRLYQLSGPVCADCGLPAPANVWRT